MGVYEIRRNEIVGYHNRAPKNIRQSISKY